MSPTMIRDIKLFSDEIYSNLYSSAYLQQQLINWTNSITSGMVFSSSSFLYAQAVNNLKHLPAATRPARPALWLADAYEKS